MLKTCQIAISKPNRNSLWRCGSASSFEARPWKRTKQASSERPSKAAGRVLKVLKLLRGAENVPDSSFEAQ